MLGAVEKRAIRSEKVRPFLRGQSRDQDEPFSSKMFEIKAREREACDDGLWMLSTDLNQETQNGH